MPVKVCSSFFGHLGFLVCPPCVKKWRLIGTLQAGHWRGCCQCRLHLSITGYRAGSMDSRAVTLSYPRKIGLRHLPKSGQGGFFKKKIKNPHFFWKKCGFLENVSLCKRHQRPPSLRPQTPFTHTHTFTQMDGPLNSC